MTKNKEVIISINPKIYPLEVIYNTSYNFIDRAYIFLDGDPSTSIKIRIKPKSVDDTKSFLKLKNDFMNELVDNALRYQITQKNKILREFIVGTALLGSLGKLNPSEEFFTDVQFLMKELTSNSNKKDTQLVNKDNEFEDNNEEELEEESKWDDPLGIATPWEEKFQPNKKINTKKASK